MIELDLNELHWNPDTCGCQIEITKEETRITGHEEFPASDLRVAQGRRATLVRSRNGSLVYRLPVYETIKVNAAGKVLYQMSLNGS